MTTLTSRAEGLVRESEPSGRTDAFAREVSASLDRAVHALYAKLNDGDHWCAELEGDSILNTEYLLMKVILGQHEPPEATEEDLARFEKMLAYVRMLQRADGTWGQYPGSPPDISAMVKAYFVLKLFGDDPNAEHMTRARERILELGGAEAINTFSMFYLACLGQASWDACPSIPPEVVLLPRWFPFHLTKVASWTRTMILPLGICSALRPVTTVPKGKGIEELWRHPRRRERLNKKWDKDELFGWNNVFLGVDRVLKTLDKAGLMVLRTKAMRRAEAWLLERMRPETTDGLAAIFPPMVYIQIALRAMGYERSHPVIVEAERQLDRFIVEEDDHIRIQPCFSPVWDTGTALYAATEAGRTMDDDPATARVVEWLLDKEVSLVGDWVENLRPEDRDITMGPAGGNGPKACGGWAFEYRNDWYPDVDDTAMVCMALRRAAEPGVKALWDPERKHCAGEDVSARRGERRRKAIESAERGVRWMLAMQNDDGGWAAFDRTTDRRWMEAVPFADHNAMQDPSCADITGRILESLVTNGVPTDYPAVRRAVRYLKDAQFADGSWYGRWGVNHIYGTWQAVGGLVAVGESVEQAYLRRTLEWLRSIQNADGGFGESANSYLDNHLRGRGPSTPSQTAWGVMSMMKVLPADEVVLDEAVRRAIAYLCETQLERDEQASAALHPIAEPAGAWREGWFTGTGFPRVFYLRYHLYRHYFPVMALGRYLRVIGRGR